MCSGLICGGITVALGTALVITSCVVGFYLIPNIVEDTIINEVILLNDTIQMERFQAIPFPLNFRVRVFNVSNVAEVEAGGIPDLREIGPYVYKLYQQRLIEDIDDDKLSYRILLNAEFDSEASFPLTEDDLVHVVNLPFHGVLQVAETILPGLMGVLNSALSGIFGDNNGPVLQTRVGDLLFDGVTLCQSPGILGGVACTAIRNLAGNIQNMEVQPDNTIKFSIFGYRNGRPGSLYHVYRGIENHSDLARITSLNLEPILPYWVSNESVTVCDMINGTDSGIFAPFVDRSRPLYALNTDICRSVELRHQYDLEYKGIPAARFSANEWFLDNDDGCFCLNVTAGISRENGCLLRGAMELYTCTVIQASL